MDSKRPHSVARTTRGRSYTLFVLAAIVTGLLALVAPLWVTVVYGGFLFCVLIGRGVVV